MNGICTKHHEKATKEYISIGNPSIINVRDQTPVKIDGYGFIGEYVPFYFTPKSMMFFNIKTGYQAPIVPQQKNEDIIVIRCLIEDLSKAGKFFFTDGQANVTSITKHYNDLSYLDQVDWEIIQRGDFKKEAGDTDKQRRYQAEFLVHNHVDTHYIESINVYNSKAATFVKNELALTTIMKPINIIQSYFFE